VKMGGYFRGVKCNFPPFFLVYCYFSLSVYFSVPVFYLLLVVINFCE
jgi:hypothetical protein